MACDVAKDLCPFFRGDSLDHGVVFKKSDDSPIDISGMTLTMTLKINKSDKDLARTSVQQKVTFESSEDSRAGKGSIHIPAKTMERLLPNRWYQYDFTLTLGADRYTIGTGKVFVKEGVRTI